MDKRSKAAWFFRLLTLICFFGLMAITAWLLYITVSSEQRSDQNRALLCEVPAIMQSEYCDTIRSQLDRKR